MKKWKKNQKKDWRSIVAQIRLMFGEQKVILQRRELQELLGVERRTIYRLAANGMPNIRISCRKIVYPVEEIARWLAER